MTDVFVTHMIKAMDYLILKTNPLETSKHITQCVFSCFYLGPKYHILISMISLPNSRNSSRNCSPDWKAAYPYGLHIFRSNTISISTWSLIVVLSILGSLIENATNSVNQIANHALSRSQNWLENEDP